MTTDRITKILTIAQMGYPVFPCKHKIPAIKSWNTQATTDSKQIRQWFETDYPDANVGMVCTGLIVIDVDNPQGIHWLNTQTLDYTMPIQLTPRGGFHFVFRKPEDFHCKPSVGKLHAGVDVRTEGSYILVEPSTNYKFLIPLKSKNQLPPPPQPLLKQLLAVEQQTLGRGDKLCLKDKLCTSDKSQTLYLYKGQRNNGLASIAGSLKRFFQCTEDELGQILLIFNKTRCKPPLEPKEVQTIAKSISRYNNNDTKNAVITDITEHFSKYVF
jgi:hypothetical protein